MKKTWKIVSFILTICLLAGVFASCRKQDSSDTSLPEVKCDCCENCEACICEASKDCNPDCTCNNGNCNKVTPEPKQTIADAVKILEASPYTSNGITENYGLSDSTKVGVIQAKTSEVLYKTKADSEFAAANIIDFDSFDGTDAEKMAAAISAAKSANASGEVKIKLPDRDIVLTSRTVFEGFDGLYIEGTDNTQLLIDCSNVGWVGALGFTDCKNLHLNNFSVDYKVLPAIVGLVTSADTAANTITMSIPESMRSTVDAYIANPALCKRLKSVIEFNRFTGAPEEKGIYLIENQGYFKGVSFNGNKEVVLTLDSAYKFEAPVKNTPVSLAFTMYDQQNTSYTRCENVFVDGVTLYSCAGMGIVVSESKNFYANRYSIMLKDADRRMTATADGYHIVSCTGEVKVTNSIIENTHDDALNIKSGYWYNLSSYDSVERTFTVSKKTGANLMAETGDKIEFYNSSSFELLGSFTVTAVSGNTTTMILTVKERISGSVDWSKAMMTNVSKVASFEFSNNIVRNKRNRGILVQVRNALIENNAFMNVGHGSMQIASSLDVYNETTVPRDIAVKNNKLINNGYLLDEGLRGDISCFAIGSEALVAPKDTIKNVTISNNYISNSGNAGISLRGVGSSVAENNLFYNVARVYVQGLECCFELVNCGGVTLSDNYSYNTNTSETFSGIITGGMTKTDEITLKDNTNIKYQVIDGSVRKVTVNKVASNAITLDGDISDWANIGSVVEMDGASETTGKEIPYDTYKDVFEVKMAKIAWTDDGLYIGFNIYDNKLDFKTIANFWEGDGFEFFLSTITDMPNADFQLLKTEPGDVLQLSVVHSWTVPYTVAEGRTNADILAGKNSIQVKTVLRSDGYSGEVFLPFSLFKNVKKSIENNASIAMAFVFMDADRDDINRKRIQVSNVPHFVETYKTKTAKMPVFEFVA